MPLSFDTTTDSLDSLSFYLLLLSSAMQRRRPHYSTHLLFAACFSMLLPLFNENMQIFPQKRHFYIERKNQFHHEIYLKTLFIGLDGAVVASVEEHYDIL